MTTMYEAMMDSPMGSVWRIVGVPPGYPEHEHERVVGALVMRAHSRNMVVIQPAAGHNPVCRGDSWSPEFTGRHPRFEVEQVEFRVERRTRTEAAEPPPVPQADAALPPIPADAGAS